MPVLNSSGNLSYYDADVVTATVYYPFGMQMPGRTYGAGSGYRYGFNGKELDNSTGEGNLDFGARILDVRLGGRWLSLDPLMKKYPGESPYLYTGCNPIYFIDPDGKERIEHTRIIGKDGTVVIKTQTVKGAFRSVYNNTYNSGGYYTRNDYETFTTVDYRSGKKVVATSSNTLYGGNHASEIGFVNYLKYKITNSDGPVINTQFLVFGSNTNGDPGWGTKVDPNSPVIPIDFAAFESIISLVNLGIKVPDLKGNDPKKIPEIVDKVRKLEIYERDNNKEGDTEYPVGSDSCTACGTIDSKDSMNNRSDASQNDHPKSAIVPTKSKNKKSNKP